MRTKPQRQMTAPSQQSPSMAVIPDQWGGIHLRINKALIIDMVKLVNVMISFFNTYFWSHFMSNIETVEMAENKERERDGEQYATKVHG